MEILELRNTVFKMENLLGQLNIGGSRRLNNNKLED